MDFEIYHSSGAIYRTIDNSSKPYSERINSKELVLDILGCEIQSMSRERLVNGITNYAYTVLFPFNDEDGIGLVRPKDNDPMAFSEFVSSGGYIREGDFFEGIMEGKTINGIVSLYIPNQLGVSLIISKINT